MLTVTESDMCAEAVEQLYHLGQGVEVNKARFKTDKKVKVLSSYLTDLCFV